jgi:signal transduction histidine kinase
MTGSSARFEVRLRELNGWSAALVAQAAIATLLGLTATFAWVPQGGYFWPRWVWFAVAVVIGMQLAVHHALRITDPGQRAFAVHLWVSVAVTLIDIAIWVLSGGGLFWPIFPMFVLATILIVHVVVRRRPGGRAHELARRVDVLTRTRRGVVDVQAAELKRIERDLHDGAQARMVSLAMNLGLAEELIKLDPQAAPGLLADARNATLAALDELRTLMRGIQPPVLSDRGLVGALEALALDLSVPTTVSSSMNGRPATPVESAVYLAVTECLANVVRHSHASTASVVVHHDQGVLSIVISDDGVGGASFEGGSGLPGIVRRLEVFDGTIEIRSPAGGPTELTMEVRCELSSPKTSSSSATD